MLLKHMHRASVSYLLSPPAVPSHPTCHRTGAAPLDGVIWQPGAIGWEPEQNQKAPCNQGSTQDLTTPPVSGTEASLRSRLSSLPPIRLFLLPPPEQICYPLASFTHPVYLHHAPTCPQELCDAVST